MISLIIVVMLVTNVTQWAHNRMFKEQLKSLTDIVEQIVIFDAGVNESFEKISECFQQTTLLFEQLVP